MKRKASIKSLFRRIRDLFLDNDYFTRLFTTMFCCMIFPTVIGCTVFFGYISTTLETEQRRSTEAYLSALATRMEYAIDSQQMQMNDYIIKKELSQSIASSASAMETLNLLQDIYISNNNISCVFLYDHNEQKVVSNNGIFSSENFFSKYVSFENLDADTINQLFSKRRGFQIVGIDDCFHPTAQAAGRQNVCPLIVYNFSGTGGVSNSRTLCFVLEQAYLRKIIEDKNSSGNGLVFILDSSGTVLYTNADFDEAMPDHYEDFKTYTIHARRFVTKEITVLNELRCIYMIPAREYHGGVWDMAKYSLMILLIMLFLNFLTSALLSLQSYRPIEGIASSFRDHPRNGYSRSPLEKSDTYKQLYHRISSMQEENISLTASIRNNEPHTREAVFRDILNNKYRYDAEHYDRALTQLGIDFNYSNISLVLVYFDFFKKALMDYTPEELIRIQTGICDIICNWTYASAVKAETVHIGSDTFAILINTEESNSDVIAEELNKIIKVIDLENDQARIVFLLSPMVSSLAEIGEKYRECDDALRFRILNQQSQLIRSDMINKENYSVPFFLSDKDRRNIIHYISNGDVASAQRYICAMIDGYAEKEIPFIYLHTICTPILGCFSQILSREQMPLTELCGSNPYDDLSNLKSTREISDYLCHLCKLVTMFECQENQTDPILQNALNYVENNYMKDISLESISGYMGYSAKYFSRYFKEQTGMTFISYLISIRLDKAKMLLVETDKKVQDIASAVGIESSNTFIRLFKQKEGITPGQYRSMNRHVENM